MGDNPTKKIRLDDRIVQNPDIRDDKEDYGNEQDFEEQSQIEQIKDLYLDTVNRNVLDFDFEKQCSVTLSSLNVYACLVCGQYYQGRGKKTQAYFHSINEDHKVFINLNTLKVYILPENYEVHDNSFNDIKAVIDPRFALQQVSELGSKEIVGYDINRKEYRPGFIGLNNIKSNDYINVIIQLLAHVPPIRDMLLLLPNSSEGHISETPRQSNKQKSSNPADKKLSKIPSKNLKYNECSELVKRLSLLVRKMWFPTSFKSHVSPHELVQEISNRSNKAFRLSAQGDAFELLAWLLNTLHFDLHGSRKKNSSVVYQSFRGSINTISQQLSDRNFRVNEATREIDTNSEHNSKVTPFLALGLDLPLPPLFRKEGDTLIPQVQLVTLLKKYNGSLATEQKGIVKKYEIIELPSYIILHIKRFVKSDFMLDKNPTIVNFPIDNVAFGDLVKSQDSKKNDKTTSSVGGRLYNLIANVTFQGKTSINDQNDSSSTTSLQNGSSNLNLRPKKTFLGPQTSIPLVTNIPSALKTNNSEMPGESTIETKPHSVKPGQNTISDTNSGNGALSSTASVTVLPINGQYSIHLRDKATNQWYNITDLTVEPIIPQMIFLSESYIQVWERQV